MSGSLSASLQAMLAADATLSAACPGGVWMDPAPDGVDQPFVVVDLAFGTDDGYGGGPGHTEVAYEVCVVAPSTSVATARTAAARIHTLLHYATPTVSGFRVLGSRRTAPVDETIEEGSGRWVRLGGEYTLLVEAA